MLQIALQPIPKQSLTVVLENILYGIDVLETNGVMSVNITRANERVVSGQRVVAKQLIIPFRPQEDGKGNFMFLTANDELPAWEKFADTQTLLYASNAELAAVRDGGGLEFVTT